MRKQPNSTDQWVTFYVMDADGAPVPSATLHSGIADIVAWYKSSPTTAVASSSLDLLAADTTAHADWYARSYEDGILKVAFPDAPWAAGSSYVECGLDLGDLDAGYSVAGGFVTVEMGYALQNPDSGSTKLALDVKSDALITVAAGLATQASVDTANTLLSHATNGLAAIKTAVNTVDTVVDAILVDTGTTLPAQLDNLDVSSEDAAKALQRLRDHTSTTAEGAASASTIVLASFPTTPAAYIGSTVLVGSLSRTITAYTPAGEDPAEYTLSSALSPYPSTGTAVTIYGDPQAALIAYEAAKSSEVTGSGTVTAEEISKDRTWAFPHPGSRRTAANYIEATASQAGPLTVCFDLNNVIPDNAVISSITSAAISGSGATVGTAVQHTSKRKVNIPLTSITATAGEYTVTLTVVATDSEQYVVRGVLEVK